MFQFACGICLRVDVADFFHLQAAFHTDGIINATANKENIFRIDLFCGKPLKAFFVINDLLNLFRKRLQLCNQTVILLLCNLLSHFRKLDRQQVRSDQLGTVGLCGCHGDFRSCQSVEDIICFSGDGRSDHIDDSESTDTF